MFCFVCVVVVILLFVIYSRRHRPEQYVVGVDPDDDVRENIIHYDEEGVGAYKPLYGSYLHSDRVVSFVG